MWENVKNCGNNWIEANPETKGFILIHKEFFPMHIS